MSENIAPETVDSLPAWAQKMIGDLRTEAATHRKAATDAQTERDGFRDELTGIASKTALDGLNGVLADPEDLARYVDTSTLLGDDGKPDPGKYAEAAQTLITERPHLGIPAPRTAGKSGTEVTGGRAYAPQAADPAAQIASGTADFVSLVQGH